MPSWQPTATFETLRERAKILESIRAFFVSRGVLEVETQLLSHGTVTDPFVIGVPAIFKAIGASKEEIVYLQTSPEYAMKRLLAAGSGSIYQICKAFRQGEVGRFHNPEFTMLEWYRPGFDHHDLMDEMDALLQQVLQVDAAERLSYATAFDRYLSINPHLASVEALKSCAQHQGIEFSTDENDRNFWLDLLMSHCIEPHLGKDVPLFLYDFPESQAALAKIRRDQVPAVASRFEVYFKGVELANGFHELQDANEQARRFEKDKKIRAQLGVADAPIDHLFLAALQQGLPDCAGVALGIDRLIMLATKKMTVSEVLSFSFERA